MMGETVEEAVKQPLSADRVEKQMRKTGQTPFVFDTLEIMTDEAGFLPMQSINELRRQGLEELQKEILKKYRRELPERTQKNRVKNSETSEKMPVFYASVETREQLEAVLEEKDIQGVYCHISMFDKKQLWKEAFETMYQVHKREKEFYLALPYMLRDGQLMDMEQEFLKMAEQCEGFLVRNLEELGYLSKLGLLEKAVTDYSVYTFNDNAKNTLDEWGVMRTTVPLELNGKEIHARDNEKSEMIIYGYYPMMISAQCIKKTCGKCDKKSGFVKLKDRYGKYFLTKTFCDFCYNVIYNSVPTGFLEEAQQILGEGFESLRLNFTSETKEEVKNLLDTFIGIYGLKKKNVKKKNPKEMPEFTKGHFKRGVE